MHNHLDLDAAQREAVGLNYVLERLTCRTPYGKALAKEIATFGPSQSDELGRVFDNMDKILTLCANRMADLENLLQIMEHFGDIRKTAEQCLTAPLGEVECFEVKGFLLIFEEFLPTFNALAAILADIGFAPTTAALDILDPDCGRVAPFYIPDNASPELAAIRAKKRNNPTAEIAATEDAEEMRILADLSGRLRPHIPAILVNIDNIARLDFTIAKALLARKFGAVRPAISHGSFVLTNMHNPMVAETLTANGANFTKITMTLDPGSTIITGANMGGKSVAIRTAALNAALCRLGFFVFADAAEIPLFEGICLISEDLQDSRAGLSSFAAEMTRIKHITTHARDKFLFIALDEPARATNPAEGAAITRTLAARLAQSGCVCLISTHYDRVAAADMKHYQVAGLRDDVANTAFIGDWMDYRLIEVDGKTPPPRDALRICRLMGLDAGLIEAIEREINKDTAF